MTIDEVIARAIVVSNASHTMGVVADIRSALKEAGMVIVLDSEDALGHLGNVLMLLAELVPEERPKALDAALAYYNNSRPEAQVEPTPGWSSRLVHTGPLDRAMIASSQAEVSK